MEIVGNMCCDFQGRKINFTMLENFGWLVDVAIDRHARYL